jgi:hypothetical protein
MKVGAEEGRLNSVMERCVMIDEDDFLLILLVILVVVVVMVLLLHLVFRSVVLPIVGSVVVQTEKPLTELTIIVLQSRTIAMVK